MVAIKPLTPARSMSPEVLAALNRYARRRYRLALLRAAGRAAVVLLAWFLLSCVLDRVLALPASGRLALLFAGVTAVGVIFLSSLTVSLRHRRRTLVQVASEIEQASHVFDDRLVTIVSRASGDGRYAGSGQMLDLLNEQVERDLQIWHPSQPLPLNPALRPWGLAAVMVLVLALGFQIEWLEMPVLSKRVLVPTASDAPVTTTRVTVEPKNVELAVNRPLHISANVRYPGDAGVTLLTSADGSAWTRLPMQATSTGEYERVLPPLSNDVFYRVASGDAVSDVYRATVLHAPAIQEMHARCEYPAYLGRTGVTLKINDGELEVPQGTMVDLLVTTTEPLGSATFWIGNNSREMQIDRSDPRQARLRMSVDRDSEYRLTFLSAHGIAGTGPANGVIRAVLDRSPIAEIEPAGDLRLGVRDRVQIAYHAADDYGFASIGLRLQTHSGAPQETALEFEQDLNEVRGIYEFDLAPLALAIGDVVSVRLIATDLRGQQTESKPLTIVCSPRPVDPRVRQRVMELSVANRAAAAVASEWQQAVVTLLRAVEATDRVTLEYRTDVGAANRHLAGIAESVAMIRRALLRVLIRSDSPEMSTLVAGQLDLAHQLGTVAEALAGQSVDQPDAIAAASARVAAEVTNAGQLEFNLATLWRAEAASVVFAERDNLAATERLVGDRPAEAVRLLPSLSALHGQIAEQTRTLGLNANAPDAAAQLQRLVEASGLLMREAKEVDFGAEAGRWEQSIGRSFIAERFPERMAAAAHAESVRPDADLIFARDLIVASQAARRIEQGLATVVRAEPSTHHMTFGDAVDAIQQQHQFRRRSDNAPPQPPAAIHARADQARTMLASLAGLASAPLPSPAALPTAKPSPRELESLAVDANAAVAMRDYETARALDRRLTVGATTRSAAYIAKWTDAAQRIDRAASKQQEVAEATMAASADDLPALAQQQERVADDIGSTDAFIRDMEKPTAGDDWRQRATQAVWQGQEQLLAMPSLLSDLEAGAVRLERAREMLAEAKAYPTTNPALPDRAVSIAERDVQLANAELARLRQRLDPKDVTAIATTLREFSPMTADAEAALLKKLAPVLTSIPKDATLETLQGTLGKVRNVVEQVQQELAAAQQKVIERDPIVASRWFAGQAAKNLSDAPADLALTHRVQRSAADALERAWDHAVHRSAAARLAEVPALAVVYRTGSDGSAAGAAEEIAGAVDQLIAQSPVLREWGILQATDLAAVDARRRADPKGYEDRVSLYFKLLQQQQRAHGQRAEQP